MKMQANSSSSTGRLRGRQRSNEDILVDNPYENMMLARVQADAKLKPKFIAMPGPNDFSQK